MIGFGLVWTSTNLGETWTAGPSKYGAMIIDAEDTPLVTVPVAGVGATNILIPNVQSFAIYRNHAFLFRDDESGLDYRYDATNEVAVLAIPLVGGDLISVDLAIAGGGMTITMDGMLSGVIDGSNNAFALVDGAPVTDVRLIVSHLELYEGIDFLRTGTSIEMVTYVPQHGDIIRAVFGY